MSAISISKKYRSSPHNFSSQSYAFTGHPRMSPMTYAISSTGGSKFRGARSPLGLGMSGGAGIEGSLVAMNFNWSLMSPIETGLDPEIQRLKAQEKEQIKTLNNKFALFIDKLRTLEQQNQVLKTKWSILQGQKTGPSNMENMFKVHINSLKKELEDLGQQRVRLESEQGNMQDLLEEFKRKDVTFQMNLVHYINGQNCSMIAKLETDIVLAEGQGKIAVADATEKLQTLEQALQQAKQDMVVQRREYQLLMNLKLVLDIEIATYRKLLEGEENRLDSSMQNLSFLTTTTGYSSGMSTRFPGKFGSL